VKVEVLEVKNWLLHCILAATEIGVRCENSTVYASICVMHACYVGFLFHETSFSAVTTLVRLHKFMKRV